jgi:hypothetical protein
LVGFSNGFLEFNFTAIGAAPMTDKTPVPPIEGHYAILRNGAVVGPMRKEYEEQDWFVTDLIDMDWCPDGAFFVSKDAHDLDIIATISPEAMQAAASGEVERLRAANKRMLVFVEEVAAGTFKNMILPTCPPKDAAMYHAQQTLNELAAAVEGVG